MRIYDHCNIHTKRNEKTPDRPWGAARSPGGGSPAGAYIETREILFYIYIYIHTHNCIISIYIYIERERNLYIYIYMYIYIYV